ncbi:hypothetical protein EON65_01630 [archaeon]|nr:MAG: hypothetical protein EON65_01630 [archaeon]
MHLAGALGPGGHDDLLGGGAVAGVLVVHRAIGEEGGEEAVSLHVSLGSKHHSTLFQGADHRGELGGGGELAVRHAHGALNEQLHRGVGLGAQISASQHHDALSGATVGQDERALDTGHGAILAENRKLVHVGLDPGVVGLEGEAGRNSIQTTGGAGDGATLTSGVQGHAHVGRAVGHAEHGEHDVVLRVHVPGSADRGS